MVIDLAINPELSPNLIPLVHTYFSFFLSLLAKQLEFHSNLFRFNFSLLGVTVMQLLSRRNISRPIIAAEVGMEKC